MLEGNTAEMPYRGTSPVPKFEVRLRMAEANKAEVLLLLYYSPD